MALGPATVTDLFFYHQRGRALGFFTVMLTSGSHIAALFGGPVAKFLGWRWIFWITGAMNFCTLAVLVVALPETMYYKPRTYLDTSIEAPKLTMAKYRQLLRPWTTFPGVRVKSKHIIIPAFRMARYPSVLFPSLYYATQYCFSAILPAVTYSIVFETRFGWDAFQSGMAYGGTVTLASIAGEVSVLSFVISVTQLTPHNSSPQAGSSTTLFSVRPSGWAWTARRQRCGSKVCGRGPRWCPRACSSLVSPWSTRRTGRARWRACS